MQVIDKSTWKRKEHFEFFSSHDDPLYSIVSEVDCTKAFGYCKENGISFFAYYLHKAVAAANEVEEMRLRIVGHEVMLYDVIHASSTIGRADGTFAFSFVPFKNKFEDFLQSLNQEILEVQNSTGIRLNEDGDRLDTLHFTALPWFTFTSITHTKNFGKGESTPKVGVGKAQWKDGAMKMPISVQVHHGLMDGYHVGLFLAKFEELLNE